MVVGVFCIIFVVILSLQNLGHISHLKAHVSSDQLYFKCSIATRGQCYHIR